MPAPAAVAVAVADEAQGLSKEYLISLIRPRPADLVCEADLV